MKKICTILLLSIFTVMTGTESLRLELYGTKTLRLLYGKTVISSSIEVYIAETGWRPILHSKNTKLPKITKNKEWVHQMNSDSGNITLRSKSKNGKIYLSAKFNIPPESLAHYICFDIFLNKKFFYKTLKPEIGKFPRPLIAKTAIGTLIVTPLSTWSPWVIRDESKSLWRKQEQRTISLLSLSRKEVSEPFRKTLKLSLEFIPAKGSMTVIKAEKLKNFEQALRKTGEVSAAFEAVAHKLASEKLDDVKLNRIKKAFITEARNRKVYRSADIAGIVIPSPVSNNAKDGRFIFSPKIEIKAVDKKARTAAMILRDELTRYRGILTGGKTKIVIDSTSELPDEGYSLVISPERIQISGKGVTGTIHGVQTLIQLLKKDSSGKIYADCTEIKDWPESKFRGIHLIPSDRLGSADFLRNAVRRFASRYKYNVLLFGENAAGDIEWKSHPEIASDRHMPLVKVKDIIAYARLHKLKIIPLVQSLGHNSRTLKAYPELADGGDKSSLCLSHPGTRKLLSDIYDEVIELYQPEYVHIGCDESFSVGRNKLCKGRKPAELLAEHLNWCHDYLKKKGCKTIMWHDMLLESGKWKAPANSHKSLITHPALDKLKRDIIIDFWNYKNKGDFPAIEHFRNKGFQVLASGWYNPENYIMLEQAIRKNKALGTIATSWMFGLFCSTALTSQAGADAAWRQQNVFTPFADKIYFAHAHAAMLPPQPSEFANTETIPVALTDFANSPLSQELSLLPEGKVVFSGLNFEIAPYVRNRVVSAKTSQRSPEIKLCGSARGLVFLHTVNTFTRDTKVGYYEITYADGTKTKVELVNRRNIFGPGLPVFSAYFEEKLFEGFFPLSKPVWRGCSISGEPLTLQAFEWQNPNPEKKLKSVALVCAPRKDTTISLIALSTIKNKAKKE